VARPASYPDVRTALSAQYDLLVTAIARLDPAGPTDCAGWTVADLETHVALTARGLGRIAARPVAGAPTGGGVDAWARQLPGYADELDAMTKAERLSLAAQTGPLESALAGTTGEEVVEQVTGRHTLRDAAVFRLVEAVVHGLDAHVDPDRNALKLVVRELARALAERHPGRTVEVRVPPYAAVQCLEGPRHTRGTPPNVVEADPVAWVRLCTGRRTWAALVGDGSVRASGERSDLAALLPLLA
jgi:uncharacterized protein (TIGR03083 family)